MTGQLFDASELPERPTAEESVVLGGRPRLRQAFRQQVEMRHASLDDLLSAEHQARVVWEAVSQLDLSPWLKEVCAVEGHVGRNATDPRILLALWVYATLQGEGSGREIDRLCRLHPEARNMKVANGGFENGYNVQFATDVESKIIVGVEVTNAGADSEELAPMLDQQQQRYGKNAREMLVDGGFVSRTAITDAEANHQCLVNAPIKDEEKQRKANKDPFAPQKGDTPQVVAWRQRMKEEKNKEVYKLRSQTAEWVNARSRNWGLRQMPVRGRLKCRIVALLHAITHNPDDCKKVTCGGKLVRHLNGRRIPKSPARVEAR